MTRAILSMFVLLFATASFANDGGMAMIQVDAIKGTPSIERGKKTGYEIEFKGEGARALMAILPDESGVLPDYLGHAASLAIAAKDGKTDVIISCVDAQVEYGDSSYSTKPTVPTCRITLDTAYENEFGDAWEFDPKRDVCSKK